MNRSFLTTALLCPMMLYLFCTNPTSPTDNVVTADMYEPDNTRLTAKPVGPDSPSQERTLKKNDTDWISFSAVSGTSYRIFTEGSTDTRIKVYSSTGSLLVEGDDSPNNLNALVDFNCTSLGTYYAAVCGSDETVTGRYEFSISTSEGPDSYEQDSVPRLARLITTSAAQTRTLSEGDVDWVSFSVDSARDTILLTATGTCRIAMTLYDRDTSGKLASGEVGDSTTKIRRYIAAPGIYFARIAAQDGKKSGTYRLTLQLSSNGTLVTVDDYENDDTRASAKTLPGNSVIQLRSLILGDTDWVRLPVVGGRQYTLSFSSSSTVRAAMYAKDGTSLQAPQSSLFLNSSATDTVYVKIYSLATVSVSYLLNLIVMLQPSIPDDFEIDNAKIQATSKCAPSDSFIQDRTLTYINSVPDTDWVAFPVAAGKLYTIGISSSISTIPYMYLYDNVSSSYVRYNTGSSNTMTYTPTASDTMYLSIYRPSLTTPLAYTLSVSGKFSNDSFEPDSSRSTADLLTTTSAQSRQLIPGDTDWVMFTVTPGDSVAILTSGTTDTKLALFTSSGSTPILENDDILSGNVNALISWKSALGGQFYVRVTGKTAATTGAYTLQALSVQGGTMLIPDSLENDDSKSKARIITDTILIGQTRSLHLNDTDWIAFRVVAGGQYTFAVSGTSNVVNIYAYTSRDSLITTRTSTTSASISHMPATDDTIYFRISSTVTVQRYTVSMSRIAPPSPDQYEADNSKTTARFITDTVVTSELHSLTASDTDWIAFPAPAGGQYTVTISCASSYTINVYAYTARDSLFYSRTGYYNASTTRIPNYNDTMYFRVTSTTPLSRYTVSMSRIAPPAPDAYEDDDTRATAYKATGSFTQSRTMTVDDTDWVSIPALAGGRYTLSTTSLTGRITLFNAAGVQQSTTTSSSLAMTASAADTLFFQVTSQPGYPPARYTLALAVTLPILADSYENDNTLAVAKQLLVDSTIQDRTITVGDTDFTYFIANESDRVTIRATHTASYYTYLYIYDSVGTALASTYTTSGGASISFGVPRTGRYLCRITSSVSSSYAYSLSAILRKTDTLTIGTPSAKYLTTGDTLWFAVRFTSGETYAVQTTGSTDTRMWIFDSLKATSYLDYSTGNGTDINPYLSIRASRTGLYYLRILGQTTSSSGNFNILASAVGTPSDTITFVPDSGLVALHDPVLAFQFNDSVPNNLMHITSDGQYFYTINGGSASTGRIRKYTLGGTLVATYPMSIDGRGLSYNRADGGLYASLYSGHIVKIDLATSTYTTIFSSKMTNIQAAFALSPDGTRMYDFYNGTVKVYDLRTGTLLETYTGLSCGSGGNAGDATIGVDGSYMYTWNSSTRTVYVYTLAGVLVRSMILPSGTYGYSLSYINGYLFVGTSPVSGVAIWYGYNIRCPLN